MRRRIAVCPFCNRGVAVKENRFGEHGCPLSGQRVPVIGHMDRDYEARAWTVLDLAVQVQDEDPADVWTYLTSLPADELQRLMMIALAAVPVDQTLSAVFGWVYELPDAKTAS